MTDTIRKQMWHAMADSPLVMLRLAGASDHAEPMEAQLDPAAGGNFWFFTKRTNRVAAGGRAMAQFVSKGHDLFCCISGTLIEETDPSVIDRYWQKSMEVWYEAGRRDPDFLMLRFELDDAEIWTRHSSFKGLFKLMAGKRIDKGELGDHDIVDLKQG